MKYKYLSIAMPKARDLEFKAINFNWNIVCLISISSLLFFSLLYVYQVNKLTKGYYLVNKYEQKAQELLQENKDLQISLANNSVLEKISEKVKSLNFQQNSSVKYIYIPDNSLAFKHQVE